MDTETKNKIRKVRKSFENEMKAKNISSKIKRIKYLVKDFVFQEISRIDYLHYTAEEISDIINMAILYYMSVWFENHRKSYQTISAFAKEKAEKTLSDDYKNIFIIDLKIQKDFDKDKYYCALKRAEKKFKDNIMLQKRQAEMEGFQAKRHPSKKNGSDIYSLTQLNFIEFLVHADQNLIDLLFYRKKILEVTSNTRKTDALADAYKNLGIILDNLSATNSRKDLVVACMFFSRFESTYQFILTSKIAKYMKDNNIKIDTPMPDIIKVLISRIPFKGRKTIFQGVSCAPLYRKCDFIIGKSFTELKNTGCNEKFDTAFDKIFTSRIIIEETVSKLLIFFPTSTFGAWNEKDFDEAASFLINDYCIFDCLELPNLDEETKSGNSYYDYIRALYKNDDYMYQEYLALARKHLKEYQIKRNADEKKSHK